jgi:NosR/NirI family transcriptional regulator, nitrous oxide reductase regulator
MNPFVRIMRWLHTGWPAGTVEPLPVVREDGSTSVPGVFVTGDLLGVPLLKFAADSGARVVRAIAEDPAFARARAAGGDGDGATADIAVVGAGVSGIAAALEAGRLGLSCVVVESAEPFFTIANFPKAKPIFTYPKEMQPAGQLRVQGAVKEALLDDLRKQVRESGVAPVPGKVKRIVRRDGMPELDMGEGVPPIRARRVIVAIGRSGDHRRLGVPGEHLGKAYHRLFDPADHASSDCLVVGGGDSALEAATALARAGARVTLSYRGAEFARAKPENCEAVMALAKAGTLRVAMGSRVVAIRPDSVTISTAQGAETLPNDAVFAMTGREPPLEFFRRSGIMVAGEWTARKMAAFLGFLAFCAFLYNWKAGGALTHVFESRGWFPFHVTAWLQGAGGALAAMAREPSTLLGTLAISLGEPGFYYTLAYTLTVVVFGVRRIRRRRTPYITAQTLTLMAIQVLPLFLLPYIVLPWVGHNGWFDSGFGRLFADNLLPLANHGHGREYWRAFGFVLAWPLFIWNFFTDKPMAWWLVIGCVQTLVLIPAMIWWWGKGAYCGWICPCGALAETLGDDHRRKMPHGPLWNRVNMLGQAVLAVALLLFALRIVSWASPDGAAGKLYRAILDGAPAGVQLNYHWVVDTLLAGIMGVGFYFWFSGRVWCRFACPLAALMHIYTRWFSRFRIIADKKKCISCNVCTSVCHQGIDVMNFANKGRPMEDPECVRCSACVHACPTGVLTLGQAARDGTVLRTDRLAASPVQMREGR